MIVVEPQAALAEWLKAKLSREATPHLRCIGRVSNDKLIGVVGFDDWDECSAQMHVAGVGNWVSRAFLRKVFHYAFVQSGLRVVYGMIPEGNRKSLAFARHVGFTIAHRIPDAHRSGALVLLTLHRSECRYLAGEDTHGQESGNTSGT